MTLSARLPYFLGLGALYYHYKEGDAVEAYEDALDSWHVDTSAHGSTTWHQETLGKNVSAQGQMHNDQYCLHQSTVDPWVVPKALLESSFALWKEAAL